MVSRNFSPHNFFFQFHDFFHVVIHKKKLKIVIKISWIRITCWHFLPTKFQEDRWCGAIRLYTNAVRCLHPWHIRFQRALSVFIVSITKITVFPCYCPHGTCRIKSIRTLVSHKAGQGGFVTWKNVRGELLITDRAGRSIIRYITNSDGSGTRNLESTEKMFFLSKF